MSNRDFIVLYINHARYQVTGLELTKTLAQFLRYSLLLTGTKIVCAEGDCGACTVLIGNTHETELGKMHYKVINSCIMPLYLLDCHHVITVEGLKIGEQLHPIQEAMIQYHGAQCGYCTPGMVCALASCTEDAILKNKKPTRKKIANFLTGNLCRCTGYDPILNAAESLDTTQFASLQVIYHNEKRNEELRALSLIPVQSEIETAPGAGTTTPASMSRKIFLPTTLNQAIELKNQYPELQIVAGSTDLGVAVNKGRSTPHSVTAFTHIPDLYEMKSNPTGLWVGGLVTLTRFEKYVETQLPELARLLRVFASPQIKNQGTLIGNVLNASPIGDTLPYLMIAEAQVQTLSPAGIRDIPITEFYLGYKKLNLKPSEIVTGIFIPHENGKIRLYKVSIRKDLDISAVTFAGAIRIADHKISDIRLAFGGVGPTVLRMPQLEKKLTGQKFDRPCFIEAAKDLQQSLSPMSDLRGSKAYRHLLCRNLLLKFYDEVAAP